MHYIIMPNCKVSTHKLHFSGNCQNEINRYFFVCFSNLFKDIYPSYLNFQAWHDHIRS